MYEQILIKLKYTFFSEFFILKVPVEKKVFGVLPIYSTSLIEETLFGVLLLKKVFGILPIHTNSLLETVFGVLPTQIKSTEEEVLLLGREGSVWRFAYS